MDFDLCLGSHARCMDIAFARCSDWDVWHLKMLLRTASVQNAAATRRVSTGSLADSRSSCSLAKRSTACKMTHQNQVQDRHCEHCLRNQLLHNITHPVRSWAAHRLTRQHAVLHEHIYLIRMAGLSTLLSHKCEFPAPEVSGSADTAVSQGLVILHHAGIRGPRSLSCANTHCAAAPGCLLPSWSHLNGTVCDQNRICESKSALMSYRKCSNVPLMHNGIYLEEF